MRTDRRMRGVEWRCEFDQVAQHRRSHSLPARLGHHAGGQLWEGAIPHLLRVVVVAQPEPGGADGPALAIMGHHAQIPGPAAPVLHVGAQVGIGLGLGNLAATAFPHQGGVREHQPEEGLLLGRGKRDREGVG
jgi:hypothetical protein